MATIEDYILEDGVLYHLDRGRSRARDSVHKQVVRPRSLKDEVMPSLREKIISGPLSFIKTYFKIRYRYFWVGMYSEIEKWCASCVDCSTKKTPRNLVKAPLQPIPEEDPFNRVVILLVSRFRFPSMHL